MKNRLAHWFILTAFVGLYLVVSLISTVHVIEFFNLSNPSWLAVSLAVAFEIGAAASLASLIIMERMNKFMVWVLFIVLTSMQAMGNTYYAYVHLHDFNSWSELFGLIDEDIIYQKRILSIISGAILPLVALGFVKSLVDYIKPNIEKAEVEEIEVNKKIDLGSSKIAETKEDEIVVDEINYQPESIEAELDGEDTVQETESEVEILSDSIIKTGSETGVWVNQNGPIRHTTEDPVLRYKYGISQQ